MYYVYRIFFHGRRTGFVDPIEHMPSYPWRWRCNESVWYVPGTDPEDPAHRL